MVVALLIATLWPLDLFPPNRVYWLRAANGIQFAGPGVVVSKGPMTAGGSGGDDSATLEILLRPAGMESLHTILGFYGSNNPKQLLLRQSEDGLVILHENVDPRDKARPARLRVEHALQPEKLVLITVAFWAQRDNGLLEWSRTAKFSGLQNFAEGSRGPDRAWNIARTVRSLARGSARPSHLLQRTFTRGGLSKLCGLDWRESRGHNEYEWRHCTLSLHGRRGPHHPQRGGVRPRSANTEDVCCSREAFSVIRGKAI